jgi:uncharacterized protein YrrD
MEQKILFQKNANVITANGQQVGSLERVVLNPETKVVTDIVIRTGTLFNKEARVMPVEAVVETTEDQIVLSDKIGELESFPRFEERHLIYTNVEPDWTTWNVAPVTYGYPEPGSAVAPGEQFVTQIEQNIPEGTVAMKEGAKVITADGKHVGNVERVLADSSVDQITHLVMSTGMFTKELRLIPIRLVMTVEEDKVHLRVKKVSVEDKDTTPIAG